MFVGFLVDFVFGSYVVDYEIKVKREFPNEFNIILWVYDMVLNIFDEFVVRVKIID